MELLAKRSQFGRNGLSFHAGRPEPPTLQNEAIAHQLTVQLTVPLDESPKFRYSLGYIP
jgi:hypothetical protein